MMAICNPTLYFAQKDIVGTLDEILITYVC